jgi:hypothetical protein
LPKGVDGHRIKTDRTLIGIAMCTKLERRMVIPPSVAEKTASEKRQLC